MKTRFLKAGILGLSVASLAMPQAVLAGSEVVGGDELVFIPPSPVFIPTPDLPGDGGTPVSATPEVTDAAVSALNEAVKFCGKVEPGEYLVDCLSERLSAAAAMLPAGGDYAEARAAIEDAARRLNALATANASSTLPRGRAKSASGTSSTRPLTPVSSDARKSVNQQALAIIEETETILLRSAENSARRKVHYERIATAVGSSKVLLRS